MRSEESVIQEDLVGKGHFTAWNSHCHSEEVLFLSLAPAPFSEKDQNNALQRLTWTKKWVSYERVYSFPLRCEGKYWE